MVSLKIADVESYYDKKVFNDILLFALITNNRYSILPEIYRVFGKEKFLKFIDIFGGSTISVPSHESLLRTIRNVRIFLEIKNQNNGKPSVSDVAAKYGVSKAIALKAFHEMKSKIEEEGFFAGNHFFDTKEDDDE